MLRRDWHAKRAIERLSVASAALARSALAALQRHTSSLRRSTGMVAEQIPSPTPAAIQTIAPVLPKLSVASTPAYPTGKQNPLWVLPRFGTEPGVRDQPMFSSAGQIVGLIELEAPDSESVALEWVFETDGDDASLREHFARLAGRLAARSSLTAKPATDLPSSPTNRLTGSAGSPTTTLRVNADLAQLAADLADQTARVRRSLLRAVADEPT